MRVTGGLEWTTEEYSVELGSRAVLTSLGLVAVALTWLAARRRSRR